MFLLIVFSDLVATRQCLLFRRSHFGSGGFEPGSRPPSALALGGFEKALEDSETDDDESNFLTDDDDQIVDDDDVDIPIDD